MDLASLVIGRIPGTIGEVSVIALLIGAIYMVVRKVISPVIPLIYIGTVFVFTFLFGGFNLTYSLSEICAGGLIFGAFFMATDYVTSPLTPKGQIVYGLILGIANRNLPSLGCFSGGRFLCDHLQQPAGSAD